jgi:glycosyltransferase involved in cell wall biosynthesis
MQWVAEEPYMYNCHETENILLSAIIPTRNRAVYVSDLLDSLGKQQTSNIKWEILVVDNASTDATYDIVMKKQNELSIPLRYILEPKIGLHYGRHRGAKEARGKYVAYLDDDMIVSDEWVRGIESLENNTADAVVGRIFPKWEAKPPKWLLKMIRGGVFGFLGILDLGPDRKEINFSMAFGGNLFIRKELVFDLGGFHPDGMPKDMLRYRGDGETGLMHNFARKGLKVYYDPTSFVYHLIPRERMSVNYLCQRAYNQGISDSFSHMRMTKENGDKSTNPSQASMLIRIRSKSLTDIMLIIRKKAMKFTCFSFVQIMINRRIRSAHTKGWQFHQKEVKSDQRLLEWVMKDDFLD